MTLDAVATIVGLEVLAAAAVVFVGSGQLAPSISAIWDKLCMWVQALIDWTEATVRKAKR